MRPRIARNGLAPGTQIRLEDRRASSPCGCYIRCTPGSESGHRNAASLSGAVSASSTWCFEHHKQGAPLLKICQYIYWVGTCRTGTRALNLAARILLLSLFLFLGPINATLAEPLGDGFAAYTVGDYATALRILRPWADQGNTDALTALGVMCPSSDHLRRRAA